MHAKYTSKNVFMNAILLSYYKDHITKQTTCPPKFQRVETLHYRYITISCLLDLLRLISCRLFHLSHTSLHVVSSFHMVATLRYIADSTASPSNIQKQDLHLIYIYMHSNGFPKRLIFPSLYIYSFLFCSEVNRL